LSDIFLIHSRQLTTISIITAVFNSASTVCDCIEGAKSQSVQPEHIFVDGGSTDGTLDILRGPGSVIAKVVSEPDNGVYDALNKGIALATGEVIGILHGDDTYADREVLSRVERAFEDNHVDSCYGDLVYVDREKTERIVRRWCSGAYDVRRFYWGWMPPHPTFFVRRKIYEKFGGFNLSFGTAADYELMLRFLVKHRISSVYIPAILVKMRIGGLSNISFMNRLRANRMDRKAWRENDLKPLPFTHILKPLSKVGQYVMTGSGG